MLLVCLGYDAKTENLTGSDWQINTSKLMTSAKLLKGLDSVKANDVITREQAAQMMLNAIKAPTVEYDTKGSTITIGDTVIGIGGSKATYVTATVAEDKSVTNIGKTKLTNSNAYTVELGEKLFSTLKLGPATDAFERPASKWTIKSTEIGTYVNTPDLTYTEAVKLGTIYSDLALSDSIKKGAVEFVMDGAASEAGFAADGTTALSGLAITKGNSTKIGGNGVLVEVYYDDVANTAKVILVNTYAGEVTSARAKTASKDANVTVTPMNAARGGVYETEDFKVDDAVTYNYSNKAGDTGVKNVAKAEQVTGTLTGYSSSSVVVGGTTYKFNKAASISSLSGAVDKEVTLTLDKYGFVLDVDASATSTNYAVVLKYSAGAGDFNDTPKVKLLFTDGTTEIVELTAAAKKTNGSSDVTEGDIVSYTINNKGKYTLKTLDDADATTTAGSKLSMTTKGSSTIAVDGVSVANGKTIFLVATKSGSNTVYTVYTGIANVPTVTIANGNKYVASAYAKNGTVATVVYINATAGTVTSAKNETVFLLTNTDGSSYDSVKGEYYTYDAIVNGEITKIETDTSYATGIYTSMDKDSNGIATLTKDASISKSGRGTDRETNGSIGLAGSWFNYTDDCNVYYVDTDNVMSVSSIKGISKDTSDMVYYIYKDGEVTDIVILQKILSGKKLLKDGTTYALNDVVEASPSNGGSDNAVTASVSSCHNGDVITIEPAVSFGATVANISVAAAAGANGTVGSDSYTAATGDSSLAVTFTVTVVSETGVTSTGTYTLNVTVS